MLRLIGRSTLAFAIILVAVTTWAQSLEGITTERVWETEPVFQTPEAVLYDGERDVLYVTNFRKTAADEESEFLSRIDTNGRILDLRWVTGLDGPTGMALHGGALYVVERGQLARVDIEAARVEQRWPIPGSKFSNDVVIDSGGAAYVSDNGEEPPTAIFRIGEGRAEPWISSEQLLRPNGLLIDGEHIVAFDNRTKNLVRIDTASRAIEPIAPLSAGARAVGDGLLRLADDTYLVSAWSGESWVVGPGDHVVPLLNTADLDPVSGRQVNHADIGYVPQERLWIIPTFFDNRLLAYRWSVPGSN